MKLTKCEHGHYYDADKYPGCPFCDASLRDAVGTQIAASGGAGDEAGQNAPAQATKPSGPVSGWLVALSGQARGRDLRLGIGQTFLGLDDDENPVTLSPDSPLGARLAVAVYDPVAVGFTLLPGSAQALSYRNGAAVLASQPLEAGDIIALGKAALVFVPFCSADFHWEVEETQPLPDAPKPKPVQPRSIPAEEPAPPAKTQSAARGNGAGKAGGTATPAKAGRTRKTSATTRKAKPKAE